MADGRPRKANPEGHRRFGRVPDWGVDHLSLDAVVAYVDDELALPAHQRAERHLLGCAECASEVVAQRQVRTALRAADEPHVPSALLSALRSIPQEAELPGPPTGLAMTADGQLVSVLRPEAALHPARPPLGGFPAGLAPDPAPRPDRSHSRRRMRMGATAVSGLALGALTLVSLPAAAPTVPAQPDRGVLGGSVLGGTGGTASLHTGGPVLPAAVRPSGATTPTPASTTPEPAPER